jgi:CRP/FNR family transcriptional regulator, cyclic AMP receptor protein
MSNRLLALLGRARDPEHRRRVAVLAQTPLFAGLRHRLLGRLAVRLFARRFEAGEIVFQEGEPGRALYVVERGAVEIVRNSPEGELLLDRIEAPAAFGELALVDELPRSATARAAVESDLLLLYHSHFEELLEGDREVALALCRRLLSKLARYGRWQGDGRPPAEPGERG